MQKRKHNKSNSSAHERETDHSEGSVSPTSSPSDRHERKRVRWEGKSAAEDSADTDEDETESPEKVRALDAYYIPPTFLTVTDRFSMIDMFDNLVFSVR
jgi:hypothetical protein